MMDRGSYAVVKGEFHDNVVMSLGELSYYSDDYEWDIAVWLPRQDQLQEMVGDYGLIYCFLYAYFRETSGENNWSNKSCSNADTYWQQFGSMEQLWLAFVMRERFGKVWNGEEWLKGLKT